MHTDTSAGGGRCVPQLAPLAIFLVWMHVLWAWSSAIVHLVLRARTGVLGGQSKIIAFEGGLSCQLAVKLHRRGAFRRGLRGDRSVDVQPPKRSVISECDWASVFFLWVARRTGNCSVVWRFWVSHLACGDGTTHFRSSFFVGNLRHLGACEA